MKAERHCREHTSRHTSPEDGDARDSRKVDPASSSGWRLAAFISQKVFRLSKNWRSGLEASQGSCPLLQFSRYFVGILGAGVRSRWLIPDITAIDYKRSLAEFTVGEIGGGRALDQTTPRRAHLRARSPFGFM